MTFAVRGVFATVARCLGELDGECSTPRSVVVRSFVLSLCARSINACRRQADRGREAASSGSASSVCRRRLVIAIIAKCIDSIYVPS